MYVYMFLNRIAKHLNSFQILWIWQIPGCDTFSLGTKYRIFIHCKSYVKFHGKSQTVCAHTSCKNRVSKHSCGQAFSPASMCVCVYARIKCVFFYNVLLLVRSVHAPLSKKCLLLIFDMPLNNAQRHAFPRNGFLLFSPLPGFLSRIIFRFWSLLLYLELDITPREIIFLRIEKN